MKIKECKLCAHAKVCMYYDTIMDSVTSVQKSIEDSMELEEILLLLGRVCRFYERK